jgi:peroxiredoxin
MQVDVHQIAAIEVLTPQAEQVRLGSLFEAKPSALVWLRHFGCSFCLEQVRVLTSSISEIEETGGQLVLIGQGSAEQALRFQQLKAPGVQVVTDPERVSYRALGAHRSFWGLFSPLNIAPWRRGHRLGIRTEGLQGDVLQLGAAFW